MKRRDLLKSIIGVSAVCAVPAVAGASVKKYGCLDVEGHRGHKKATGENLLVYLDGREVTRCYESDDIRGYVKVFCTDELEHRRLDAKGAIHLNSDHSGVCKLLIQGSVVMAPERVLS